MGKVASFNTSHVVIYRLCLCFLLRFNLFQYISCCYLSNDSKSAKPVSFPFQYISCCYLSEGGGWYVRKREKFQYISCCYLSKCFFVVFLLYYLVSIHLMLLFINLKQFMQLALLSFNTSHVVIYPIISIFTSSRLSFNTSHVVIYLNRKRKKRGFDNVSIHLMLLFIVCSCYRIHIAVLRFNTSHVVIYPYTVIDIETTGLFQYISCCYLSHCYLFHIFCFLLFQYISCCYLSSFLFCQLYR